MHIAENSNSIPNSCGVVVVLWMAVTVGAGIDVVADMVIDVLTVFSR